MDVLGAILQSVRFRSHLFGRLELTAPWGLRLEKREPHFIGVAHGAGWLEVDGLPEQVRITCGDFILLPRGGPASLRDHPDTPSVPFRQLRGGDGSMSDSPHASALRFGGGGTPCALIGGLFTFEDGWAPPFVEALPPMIHVKGNEGEPLRWLASTLQFLSAETASGLPGAETIQSRLADVLFVQAVRAHIAANREQPEGWLRALTDPQIGKALWLIHDQPGNPWTVDALAECVAMSRSAFADRFRALVGVPPLGYLTRWRMHKATQLLRREDTTIASVAYAVGYESEGSFRKVFKRYTGSAPGEFRAAASRRGRRELPAEPTAYHRQCG